MSMMRNKQKMTPSKSIHIKRVTLFNKNMSSTVSFLIPLSLKTQVIMLNTDLLFCFACSINLFCLFYSFDVFYTQIIMILIQTVRCYSDKLMD